MNNGPYLAHKTHKYISREWKNGRWDMRMSEGNMQRQFNEQKYRRSFQRHLNDAVSDIRNVSEQSIDAGKKKVAEILRSMADKLDD